MEGKGFVQTSSPLSSYTCFPAGEPVGRREGEEGKEKGGKEGEKRVKLMNKRRHRRHGGVPTLHIPALHSHPKVPSLDLSVVDWQSWVLARKTGNDVRSSCRETLHFFTKYL